MKRIYLFLIASFLPELAISQFYFPLRTGNSWLFMDCGGLVICEGNMIAARILKDSTIGGKKYSLSQGLPTPRFLRQEGNRVFGYETTETTEFVLFDFSAKAGDTVSVHANRTKFIIAAGNNIFSHYDTTRTDPYRVTSTTLRDSFGITYHSSYPCSDCCRSGFIDGKSVVLDVADHSVNHAIPATAALEQNFPNPFNPTTLIRFAIPSESLVTLEVFNALGESVTVLLSERVSAGWHSVSWNASNLASGHYYCRLKVGQSVLTTTMVLLK